MLEIRKITKKYKTGDFSQKALNSVSVNFRECEFVSVLGPSGSGKTTLLNIIGGLDKYTSGDLVINGISTKKYKDKDWDAYRNHRIGFVFQSYNLIPHQTVLSNVELALTLSGVSKKERRRKAKSVLKKVGLEDHINKKPNQLSGGQMQRVAIARALINDPDILLADEPTGALDSATSVQIMKLLKEISEEKLVIMVTHNPDLANEYSTRIIRLKDGEITGDTDPYLPEEEQDEKTTKSKKTSMSFLTALKLSFNNIRTKKGRTILTAFASSIGIIGIALILSLSNGFNLQIKKYEKGIMSAMPIIISEQTMNMTEESIKEISGSALEKYPDIDYVIAKKPEVQTLVRINKITKEYVDYLETMPKEYSYGIAYNRYMRLNIVKKTDDGYTMVDPTNLPIGTIPKSFNPNKPNEVIESYYDIIGGRLPENDREMVLIVTATNQVTDDILDLLGLSKEGNISFEDLLNSSIHVVLNNDMYKEKDGYFTINTDLEELYDNSIELKLVGLVRMNKDFPSYVQSAALTYTEEFASYLIEQNKKSNIVKKQQEKDYNILTGMAFTDQDVTSGNVTKESILGYLGDDTVPYNIMLYPKDFDSKKDLLAYLDKYNESLDEEDKIIYTDQAALISSMSGSIMDAVTIVLIAFSSISLIVSCIMIGIITYISVLERTKEIGILRALGARKKDISRVFNAETFIIGVTSGLIGIFIAFLLTFPANMIIYKLSELSGVAKLNPVHALILIIISTTLTMIGGLIPARVASKKDPVIALRTE